MTLTASGSAAKCGPITCAYNGGEIVQRKRLAGISGACRLLAGKDVRYNRHYAECRDFRAVAMVGNQRSSPFHPAPVSVVEDAHDH